VAKRLRSRRRAFDRIVIIPGSLDADVGAVAQSIGAISCVVLPKLR
jgi:hypothetical protein